MKKLAYLLLICFLILLQSFVFAILHNEIINEKQESTLSLTDNQAPDKPIVDYVQTQTTLAPDLQSTTIPSQTESQTDTKTQASIVKGVIVNNEMQSFEEWKESKLKDNTISDSNKVKIIQNSKLETKEPILQRRKNYASLDCGAKIIANNKEANNPSHILTESKDDYMLNSCSAKVWFIVELCEAIKINELQIANHELFSNVPRQFKVYASERFVQSTGSNNWPSKYFIGTFEANNTRNLQTFSLKDTLELKQEADVKEKSTIIYVKYVKFEMLSHYGNEHYCPLSVVRIYGTSLNDEDEGVADDVSHLDVDHGKKDEKQEENRKENSKLFELSSIFLTNIISVFLGEKFKFFSRSNINELNVTKPSKSTRLASENEVVSFSNRKLVLDTDMHRILCFTSSISLRDCCQCYESSNQMNKVYENSSFNFYSSQAQQYCSYYYLMITSVQARSNSSLLTKYLQNIKPSEENHSNFTQFSFNNINYYILNEWLDNQTLSTESPIVENLNVTESVPIEKPKHDHSVDAKDKIDVKTENLEIKKKDDGEEVEKKVEPEVESVIKPETTSTSENLIEIVDNLNNNEELDVVQTTTLATTTTQSVTQAPIPNSKDALFIRLTNRIKVLELNMSLSSQYLEKLSQHYRKQMDEMQKAFNLTTSALIDTIRVADERDVKQNEKIIMIEKKIEKIEKSLNEVDSFLNDVKSQTYMIIYTAIFVLTAVICIELSRCLMKNDNKDFKKEPYTDEKFVNIDEIVEAKCKALLDKQEENFRKRIEEIYKLNQMKCENLEATSIMDTTPQQMAAARVVSSTIAVVAAVSLAAANAQLNSVSQKTDEVECAI